MQCDFKSFPFNINKSRSVDKVEWLNGWMAEYSHEIYSEPKTPQKRVTWVARAGEQASARRQVRVRIRRTAALLILWDEWTRNGTEFPEASVGERVRLTKNWPGGYGRCGSCSDLAFTDRLGNAIDRADSGNAATSPVACQCLCLCRPAAGKHGCERDRATTRHCYASLQSCPHPAYFTINQHRKGPN